MKLPYFKFDLQATLAITLIAFSTYVGLYKHAAEFS